MPAARGTARPEGGELHEAPHVTRAIPGYWRPGNATEVSAPPVPNVGLPAERGPLTVFFPLRGLQLRAGEKARTGRRHLTRTVQVFSPSPPARRKARAGQTPRAARIWLVPAKRGRGTAASTCPILGPSGKPRQGRPRDPPPPQTSAFDGRPPGPAASLCPLRGLQLKAREKQRSRHHHLTRTRAVPSPSPPAPRKLRQARHHQLSAFGLKPREGRARHRHLARAILGLSGARGSHGRLDPPRPSAFICPLRGLQLRAGQKGRGHRHLAHPHHPRALRSRRQPRQAGHSRASLPQIRTSTPLCHHRALRGRGGVDGSNPPPAPAVYAAFECRRPPPATGLCPAPPRGTTSTRRQRSPTAAGASASPYPHPGPADTPACLRAWQQPADGRDQQTDSEPNHRGRPPNDHCPALHFNGRAAALTNCSLALPRQRVNIRSQNMERYVPAPGTLQERRL